MVYVYDFLNFFALLVISSKSLNVFVKIEDQYSSAHVPWIAKAHENLIVFFTPVQTLQRCLLLILGLEQ